MKSERTKPDDQFDDEPSADLGETLREIVNLLIRRRWWILLPTVLIALAVIGVALRIPNVYKSEAVIAVVQQQVAQRYVTVDATPVEEAVGALTRQILSRTSLLRIIKEMDLYPDMVAKGATTEDLSDQMLKDLGVDPITGKQQELTGLNISFVAYDRRVAQAVTSRLTSLFIEENLKRRGGQVESVTSFVGESVKAAADKLAAQEQRLRDFRTRHLGSLPEQQAANLQTILSLRTQQTGNMAEIGRVGKAREALMTSLSDKLAAQIASRDTMLKKMTPQHPEVVKKDREIANLESVRDLLRIGKLGPEQLRRLAAIDDPSILTLKEQAEANSTEMNQLLAEKDQLTTRINEYEARLNAAPLQDQELAELTRGYNLLKDDYNSLRAKQLQSNLGAELEDRQEGQSFRMVDAPTLPVRPFGPKRIRFAAGGIVGGLVIGVLLAFVIDKSKRTFRTEKAIRSNFDVPMVLGIPVIMTRAERRARIRRIGFEWVAALALMGVLISAGLYMVVRG